MRRIFLYALVFILLSTIPVWTQAQTFQKYFIDSTDRAFDMSRYLASVVGFMPTPIIITEPAVGYGGGLSLMYFHRSKEEKETGKFSKYPPSISILAGMYTENGTWGALLAHQGNYAKNHIRYMGAIGWINLNADFYYSGTFLKDIAIRFNLNGFLLYQQLLYRPWKPRLFLGLNYSFFMSKAKFNTERDIPQLDELKTDIRNGGMNLVIQWDTRDNIFTPNQGAYITLEGGYYGEALGGQKDYLNLELRAYYFSPVFTKKLISGFRLQGQYRWDDVPFYNLPFIQMRGIPALRYQGNMAYTAETEWRWNFWRRWSVIGFVGSGWVANEFNELMIDQAKIAYGTGFRYFIAKEYGMQMGLDFAWGPENFAWYITVGTAWMR